MPETKRTDEEIITGFEFWLKSITEPNQKSFSYDGNLYSPSELVQAVKEKTPLGNELLETIRSLSQKLGMDPVSVILIAIDTGAA